MNFLFFLWGLFGCIVGLGWGGGRGRGGYVDAAGGILVLSCLGWGIDVYSG